MQSEVKNPTPSLAGCTELVVLAPLRKGLVPSLESVTYKTRTKLLLRTLHSGRKNLHEYQLVRALSDAVERVGVIHAVRVAVLEPQGQVLLSVNFDGGFESYVRVIWQKSSRLLDLIFCNTEGYPLGWRSSFAVWRAWLESVRVDTPFFYAPPGHTYQDSQYLRLFEQRQRRAGDEMALARLAIPPAERIAWDMVLKSSDINADTPVAGGQEGLRAGLRQGLQSLVGLYRLADLYLPGTVDGQVLLDAAHELLPEFARLQTMARSAAATDRAAQLRFQEQVAWFRQPNPLPAARQTPVLPDNPALPLNNVQGGVLAPYDDVSHGLLCLVSLDGPAAAAVLLARLAPAITKGSDRPRPGGVLVNVAFTAEGLRVCGLDETMLDWLPSEFRQGMDARAGLLGDLRQNHPRRWALPLRNWPQALNPAWQAPADTAVVATSAVHLLLQLRWVAGPGQARRADGPAALANRARALLDHLDGVLPLSLQWMARVDAQGNPIDHFGFTDGQSQPVFSKAAAGSTYENHAALGEVLVGHANAADAEHDLPENQHAQRRRLLRDGSFLVLRKLRQNVGLLRRAVDAVPLDRDLVLAKMMGRWPVGHAQAGLPLVPAPAANRNDFDYASDPVGDQCPLSSHIRLANPRQVEVTNPTLPNDLTSIPGGRPPRLVRRSMPYGPAAPAWPDKALQPEDEVAPDMIDADDRGLVFMAYNASIGEQFEVVQRWLAGGNSSGMVSAHADPFLGVSQPGQTRTFRFTEGSSVHRVALDGSAGLGTPPTSIVALQWGLYLFAPSLDGLNWLAERASSAAAGDARVPWSVAGGARCIAQLQQLALDDGPAAALAAWKMALEDPEGVSDWQSASIWAAIRQLHGGALRTPYGVLVASRPLVDTVLKNSTGHYTAAGYLDRLSGSIGPIYLGQDAGADYAAQSTACNAAIMALQGDDGFRRAWSATHDALDRFIADARDRATDEAAPTWELLLDLRELMDQVLARLCEAWFGLSEAGGHFKVGGARWHAVDPATGLPDGTPRYPGFFTAPSRATFQPHPGATATELARRHGQALRTAMNAFLAQFGPQITAPVTQAVLGSLRDSGGQITPASLDLAARTITGALMGFLPTTAGSLRRVLGDWLLDGSFWTLRSAHAGPAGWDSPATAMHRMHVALRRTMQARPVPEMVWRKATAAHNLGDGAACSVQAGDLVVLGLVSATQQGLETGVADVYPVFGGNRRATAAPTHACPGYDAAMGVIVGLLAALLSRPEVLRPGPAPGSLSLEGAMSAAAAADHGAADGPEPARRQP